MPDEYQSPDSRSLAAIDESYSYTGIEGGRATSAARGRNRTPADLFRYRVLKRGMDIILVIAAAPVLFPIILVVSALVGYSSPGPIFFSHRRIRKDGTFFSMWKFRTMCVNSAEVLEDHLAHHPEARLEWKKTRKFREDPRVTPIGSFLRRYSLDELPQVWNVLCGTMSLVGPRPIVAAEVEKYGEFFSCYCRVNPGLTGLWQVSGRSQLSYAERVQLDCRYVNSWSLLWDLRIIMKTFLSVANSDGAF